MPIKTWLQDLVTWVQQNEVLISVLSVSSVLVLIGTMAFIPWLILQLPADYFSRPSSDRYNPLGNHPVAIAIVNTTRNILGVCFILIGIILLVLPGQGLLTIILGLLITRFPGKRRLVYWIVARHGIHETLNWIRRKGHKPPIKLKQPSGD